MQKNLNINGDIMEDGLKRWTGQTQRLTREAISDYQVKTEEQSPCEENSPSMKTP